MEKNYQSAPRKFFDSHRTFTPFIETRRENETEREYDRRMYNLYLKLTHEKERPDSSNRVYMNYLEN